MTERTAVSRLRLALDEEKNFQQGQYYGNIISLPSQDGGGNAAGGWKEIHQNETTEIGAT